MVDYSPWGRKELDTTERLHFMFASHVDLFFLDIFFFLILPTKKFNTTDILHIYCMCICVLLIKCLQGGFCCSSSLRTTCLKLGFPCSLVGKEPAWSARVPRSIPGLGRSPAEENSNPLQYYCLGNLIDRGTWQAKSMESQGVRHDLATKPPQFETNF